MWYINCGGRTLPPGELSSSFIYAIKQAASPTGRKAEIPTACCFFYLGKLWEVLKYE